MTKSTKVILYTAPNCGTSDRARRDLIADGVVKVEGRVKGNIRAGNQILIAPGATIEGDLHTKEAVIGGDVRGVIHAGERVELQATAVVEGDIHTPRIAILEGARVTGEVKMDAVVAQPA